MKNAHVNNHKSGLKLNALSWVLAAFTLSSPIANADAIDDAFADDKAALCANQPTQELYKIANKKQNSDSLRRDALEKMMEVSQECSNASDQRLTQYHQKAISAAYDVMDFTEEESRQVAVEVMQFIVQLPDEHQPPEGSISRGNKLAQVALNDSSENIRLWALEALMTLRGNNTLVQNTLTSAAQDSSVVVSSTASDMLSALQ